MNLKLFEHIQTKSLTSTYRKGDDVYRHTHIPHITKEIIIIMHPCMMSSLKSSQTDRQTSVTSHYPRRGVSNVWRQISILLAVDKAHKVITRYKVLTILLLEPRCSSGFGFCSLSLSPPFLPSFVSSLPLPLPLPPPPPPSPPRVLRSPFLRYSKMLPGLMHVVMVTRGILT